MIIYIMVALSSPNRSEPHCAAFCTGTQEKQLHPLESLQPLQRAGNLSMVTQQSRHRTPLS